MGFAQLAHGYRSCALDNQSRVGRDRADALRRNARSFGRGDDRRNLTRGAGDHIPGLILGEEFHVIESVDRSAEAATLFFEAVRTTTSTCPVPCYEIRVFYEDSSRKLPVQGLRFDLAISGAKVPVLSVPPAANLDLGGGNGFEKTAFSVQPWNLRSVVEGSSDPDYDVWIGDEADTPLTIDTVAARFAGSVTYHEPTQSLIIRASAEMHYMLKGNLLR